ncbi:hypothetical protein M378DRAFT_166582 [Amanita muscaria Koide BX008]|uniref:Uncharacterized protein n=1 Tax=Amanita muscaria (strain Koide BX008) TaxID=946122 RepID=A0A0C2SF06_AMAMK|nr:hypothetical protein M378DRAFT_166582 [Amanita muscaria Koide BX008]
MDAYWKCSRCGRERMDATTVLKSCVPRPCINDCFVSTHCQITSFFPYSNFSEHGGSLLMS